MARTDLIGAHVIDSWFLAVRVANVDRYRGIRERRHSCRFGRRRFLLLRSPVDESDVACLFLRVPDGPDVGGTGRPRLSLHHVPVTSDIAADQVTPLAADGERQRTRFDQCVRVLEDRHSEAVLSEQLGTSHADSERWALL